MKNITFSADEHTIELARDEARKNIRRTFDELDAHITHLPKLSREPMNER